MRDATARDWASARRRRWSAPRIGAAIALHALLLVALTLAIDRVDLPRRGGDRATTLVSVTLQLAPPPPLQALPPPTPRAPATAHAHASRAPEATREPAAQAITLPTQAPAPPTSAIAAAPAASSPPDLKFLDDPATRQAIRAVARGQTLASRANALTHEEAGSELVAADGSHDGSTRNLATASPAAALAQGVGSAHKADCMKDLGGMGLLAAPAIVVAEAMGKCAHKL
jgi:hypothetical protein